ncbi:MAG: tripartite tricarboxylate transporter substrate-binding protein [Beijerinckiaceae bacterium]|nr:tripartite tricarboxylate transporter substrate-binding protein [Beijerinckiaceae bacterium]
MAYSSWRALALLSAIVGSIGAASPSLAQEEFYKGRTINLYIGFAPGGSYDLYARTLARHMGKHIPGSPTIVAQTTQGAGSFRAANHLFAVAPKDGSAMGMVSQAIALEEMLGTSGIMFKSSQFTWIGRSTNITELMMTWRTSKTQTYKDALTRETPIASTGPGSPSEGWPRLLNGLAGTKFKIIGGYQASANALLAMERGEVDASFTSWDTLNGSKPEWLKNKSVNILVQFNRKRLAELPDTPSVVELATRDEDRRILDFYVTGAEVGRSFIAPPGLPPERTQILRAAFMKMSTEDADYKTELARAKAPVNAMPGDELQAMITAIMQTPPALVERMRKILSE